MIIMHTAQLLNGVINEKKYSNLLLNEYLNKIEDQTLKPQITHLFYTSLKHYLLFSEIIDIHLTTKIKKMTRCTMVVAMSQFYLSNNVKVYAIVNESVDYLKKRGYQYDANVVNASLKNIFNTYSTFENLKASCSPASQLSVPEWLYNMFVKQYTKETSVRMFEYFNATSALYGRLLNGVNFDNIAKKYDVTMVDEQTGTVLFKNSQIINAFKEDEVYIQDYASQQVAPLFKLKKDMKVLDMCSAPGGKLQHLASLNPDTKIIANDVHPHKITLLESLTQKYNLNNVELICQDALNLSQTFTSGAFDAILLDAPCSGLGVLNHKPEIKYRILPTDLDALQSLQFKMLDVAYDLLKVGGQLVYATCTLNKKENEKQIQAFITRHKDMEIMQEKTTLGFEQHTDGFYFCKLIKQNAHKCDKIEKVIKDEINIQ